MFNTVLFGGLTLGSAVWGQVAAMVGLPLANFIAAAGAVLVVPLTWRWKLQTAAGLDDGVYVFQVTDPSGKTLLSTDAVQCRQFTVSGGIIVTTASTNTSQPRSPAATWRAKRFALALRTPRSSLR